jgi:hypothetical protein
MTADCYAWDIPTGCYAAADAASPCLTPWWFWLAVAGAGVLAFSKPHKARNLRAVRGTRRRRR